MEATERKLALEYLAASRDRLYGAVAGLSPEQHDFRPAEGCWSVADCVEHLVVVEKFVLKTIHSVLEAPPEPAKRAEVRGKDQIVIEMVPVRTRRVHGPDAVQPQQRWPHFEDALGQFGAARASSMSFATETDADLRSHFFPHPFLGDLDCYQWLLFLGLHCERHVRQMEEVMADPAFPRGLEASA